MEAKIKSQAVFEESSLKEVVEASWGEDSAAGLRGGIGFTKRALKEERFGLEAGKMCLSSYGLDRSAKTINWMNIFFLISERSRQSRRWICGFHSDVALEAFVWVSFALTAITLEGSEYSAFLPGKCKYTSNMEVAENATACSSFVIFVMLPEYVDVGKLSSIVAYFSFICYTALTQCIRLL